MIIAICWRSDLGTASLLEALEVVGVKPLLPGVETALPESECTLLRRLGVKVAGLPVISENENMHGEKSSVGKITQYSV